MSTHTGTQPYTVVVKSHHTVITSETVSGSGWSDYVTGVTEFKHSKHISDYKSVWDIFSVINRHGKFIWDMLSSWYNTWITHISTEHEYIQHNMHENIPQDCERYGNRLVLLLTQMVNEWIQDPSKENETTYVSHGDCDNWHTVGGSAYYLGFTAFLVLTSPEIVFECVQFNFLCFFYVLKYLV